MPMQRCGLWLGRGSSCGSKLGLLAKRPETWANELLPDEARDALSSGAAYLRSRVSSRHTITVERKLDTFTHNHVYEAVRTYLAGHANIRAQQHLCVSSMDEDEKMTVALADGEEMADVYDGAEFSSGRGARKIPIQILQAKKRDETRPTWIAVVPAPAGPGAFFAGEEPDAVDRPRGTEHPLEAGDEPDAV
ncbi:AAA-ATPase [Panicum miliaceum]|uniref:AAA-ATPase n=1 Tax=Panicum miliaceum TaxID=4540 RepID=A0A3L6R6N4_PANMI|nr:AAA-ATPase [Panicum miliaceum]